MGINIAGRIIEKIAGISYETYMQETILKPLGISASSPGKGGSTHAPGYTHSGVQGRGLIFARQFSK